jgi:heat shock protein HspQ
LGPSAQLPHLLRLLDDTSPTVRLAITRAFESFGPELEEKLAQLDIPATAKQIAQIRQLLDTVEAAKTLNESAEEASDTAEEASDTAAGLAVGQLVRHARYDYRGVVVAADPTCRADDDWYLANHTQPDRDQPWYHVLVHGSHEVTYAARSSLLEDLSDAQVDHPLISQFFSAFHEGRYVRNDNPWPQT